MPCPPQLLSARSAIFIAIFDTRWNHLPGGLPRDRRSNAPGRFSKPRNEARKALNYMRFIENGAVDCNVNKVFAEYGLKPISLMTPRRSPNERL